MARDTQVGLPEDEYLVLIGQVAYMVSALEWTILGDLPRHALDLPSDLTQETLAHLPTGVIAGKLKDAVDKITKDDLRAYIERGAEVLQKASVERNDMLHARPATAGDGNQRIYRWTKDRQLLIDTEWLERTIDYFTELSRSLEAVRPALP